MKYKKITPEIKRKYLTTIEMVRCMEKMRQRGLKQPYLKGSKGFVKFGFD
jgi:hypothetical protein